MTLVPLNTLEPASYELLLARRSELNFGKSKYPTAELTYRLRVGAARRTSPNGWLSPRPPRILPDMSAARIITPPPMSGGNRKHFAREIHKAEVTFANLVEQSAQAHVAPDAARAKAYALDCAAWSTALFTGELGFSDYRGRDCRRLSAPRGPLRTLQAHRNHRPYPGRAAARPASRAIARLSTAVPASEPSAKSVDPTWLACIQPAPHSQKRPPGVPRKPLDDVLVWTASHPHGSMAANKFARIVGRLICALVRTSPPDISRTLATLICRLPLKKRVKVALNLR